jgi:ABC-type nitrate/sulfonate/bicarbonate transport system permease component
MLVIGVCGFMLDRILLWARRRLVHWEHDQAS